MQMVPAPEKSATRLWTFRANWGDISTSAPTGRRIPAQGATPGRLLRENAIPWNFSSRAFSDVERVRRVQRARSSPFPDKLATVWLKVCRLIPAWRRDTLPRSIAF